MNNKVIGSANSASIIRSISSPDLQVSSAPLTIDAKNTSVFPTFETEGWDWRLQSLSAPCFAWVLNDKEIGQSNPGKGHNSIHHQISFSENLHHPYIIENVPSHVDDFVDKDMASYAKHKFETILDRDKMIAVEPDENNVLYVPEGTRPIMLSVMKKPGSGRGPDQPAKYVHHWYRADRIELKGEEKDSVLWSHWADIHETPTRAAGPHRLTDPWKQCSANKCQPVSFFLIPANPEH